ncbi:hypothetical protein [Ascidiimonas sp. W6]|uniref:hypothetical protein n=1 Tax=Ascidiimonas meishanensis TaxID=3128903 RepID=UPI0030EDD801
MKKSIKKLRLEKKTVSKLNTVKAEIKGGAARSHHTCFCNYTNYWGGCPLQTNEQDTNGYYIC